MTNKNIAYLVKSQEAYGDLMEELEKKGYLWMSGEKPTKTNYYLDHTSDYVDGMCIYLRDKYVSYGDSTSFREHRSDDYDLIEYPGYGELKVVIEADPVNHPSHYQIGGIETLDLIEEMLSQEEFIGYLKGNIIKYRERHPYKGKSDQDLEKAKFYWDLLQELEWKKGDS